jgi:hypothetical protein
MSSEIPKLKAELIIEVLGRPKEHLVETLENLTNQMNEEKGVKVERKTIHEPHEVKDRDDFFSSYAEVEIEVDGTIPLVLVMFKYMPSNIEITYPEKVSLANQDFSETLNEISRRLHRYEELVRVMEAEKKILENKLKKE